MCTVSMVIDRWHQDWPHSNYYTVIPEVSRAEFEALKRQLEELKEIIKAAKVVDDFTQQPDCEKPEKVALLRKVAEALGVDLTDVLAE